MHRGCIHAHANFVVKNFWRQIRLGNKKPGGSSRAPGAASRYGEIDSAFDQTRQARPVGFSCADETNWTRIRETLKRDSGLRNSKTISPQRSRRCTKRARKLLNHRATTRDSAAPQETIFTAEAQRPAGEMGHTSHPIPSPPGSGGEG